MAFAFLLSVGGGLWAFVTLLRKLYYICQPSEVLIFAGLRRRTAAGTLGMQSPACTEALRETSSSLL